MSNRVACPSHPDANLIEDYRAGDMICSMCGLVVDDCVIDFLEWRNNKGGHEDDEEDSNDENHWKNDYPDEVS